MIIDRQKEMWSCWGGKPVHDTNLFTGTFTLKQIAVIRAPEAETLEMSLMRLLMENQGIILLDGQILCSLVRKRCITRTPLWLEDPDFNGYVYFAAALVEFLFTGKYCKGYPTLYARDDGTPGNILIPPEEKIDTSGRYSHHFAVLRS